MPLQPTNTWERLCFVGYDCKSSILPTPRSFSLFRNFLHVVPKLPGGFNPREVVLYRQMELIRTETVERMNELLEGVVDIVGIAGDSLTATTNTFSLCCCGSQDKQWLQNLLVLPSFPLQKTGPPWKKWWFCEKSVWECYCCCSSMKEIAVATTDNGTNNIKGMRDRGIEDGLVQLFTCEQSDKEHNEESEQQQQCWPASKCLEGSVKFNPTLQKEMRRKRGQEDQWLPRDKVWGFIYM